MKHILVTGARSGLGNDIIDKIKDKDYYIYATCHTLKEVNSLKLKYKDYKNIECFKLDLLDNNDRDKLNELKIDILLCNAAISYGGNLIELDINDMRNNYEVNIFNNLDLIQRVIKKNIFCKCKIIIMSSLAGIIPLPFIGSYASTKASLIKISEILRKEVKMLNKNIKIVLIEPGLYLTGFNRYMFLNKYEDNNSLFKDKTTKIKRKEELILKLLGHKEYKSITNKIVKAINTDNPKHIYRAPLLQVIGAKVYSLLFQ